METHAHDLHKAPGHGWKHYLFEFFMLFLAVFCGFLAENWREHLAEKERATDLAHSFYDELKRDSASIQTVQMRRIRRDSALTYLKKYFRDSSVTHCSKTFGVNFTYAFEIFSPYLFEPKDAILDQLKNSGSLRYFKSMELQKLTGDLSEAIANIRTRNGYESNYVDANFHPYLIKHNDMEFFDTINSRYKLYFFDALAQYENSTEIFPFHFNKPEEFDKTESVNMLGSYQMICYGASIRQYADYQKLNTQLLQELRKEYHIE
jgi:hypothetical protein